MEKSRTVCPVHKNTDISCCLISKPVAHDVCRYIHGSKSIVLRFCCAGRPHFVNAVENKQPGPLLTRASKARRHLRAMRNCTLTEHTFPCRSLHSHYIVDPSVSLLHLYIQPSTHAHSEGVWSRCQIQSSKCYATIVPGTCQHTHRE